MKSNINVGIVIGRFQPLHNGHMECIKKAIVESDLVIVVIGSANRSVSPKNPFKTNTISNMISEANEGNSKLSVISSDDYLYNEKSWINAIKLKIYANTRVDLDNHNVKYTLFGHYRDDSSYYLDRFDGWEFREVGCLVDNISATNIRNCLFETPEKLESVVGRFVPANVLHYMQQWTTTKSYEYVRKEYFHIKQYRQSFENVKYPPVFVTADAVITHGNMVYVQKRKSIPGEGLLSLPGGFIKNNQTILDSMYSIVSEKAGMSARNLELKSSRVFDHPARSERGRIITNAFWFENKGESLPDSSRGKWIDLTDVSMLSTSFFEDHAEIIREMLSLNQ